MKSIILILFLFFSLKSFSTVPNDNFRIGTSQNVDKGIQFNFGNGISDPKLEVLSGDSSLNFDRDIFGVGTGAATGDKAIRFNGYNARVGVNGVTGKLSFDNGTGFKAFGTGSGGGGENYNNGFGSDDNGNAEDGTTGWTNSGSGTFAVTTIDPLEGSQSFEYTPSAQNDYVESDLLSFDSDRFRGVGCEAQIYYVGGDGNLTLKVIDGNGDVLRSLVLPSHSFAATETISFLCPTATEISGDANKGNLKLRIENVGASAAALIKWDKTYMGTIQALAATTLPDILSSRITSVATTPIVSSKNTQSDWISSVTVLQAGFYEIFFQAGTFTVQPECSAVGINSGGGGTYIVTGYPYLTTSIRFSFKDSSGAFVAPNEINISCRKQDADAKQTVQVYKSFPKTADVNNNFSAYIGSNGVVSRQNIDNWVVSCNSGLIQTCDISGANFTQIPVCHVEIEANDGSVRNAMIQLVSTTSLTFIKDINFNSTLKCNRGTDFKVPIVQPIVVPNAIFYGPFDLTVSAANWSTVRAIGYIYRVNGSLRFLYNIAGSLSSSSSTLTLDVNGVIFKNISGYFQAVDGSISGQTTTDSNVQPNTGNIFLQASGLATDFRTSGDVELESHTLF